jgi:hypothetical protein
MRAIENKLLGVRNVTLRRIIAVLLTFVAVALVLFLVVQLLLPQLITTVETLIAKLPGFAARVWNMINDFLAANPEVLEWVQENTDFENMDWMSYVEKVLTWISDGVSGIVGGTFSAIGSVFTGVFNGKACTPCAASVYTGEQPERKITRGGWNISFEQTLDNAAECLKSVKVTVYNFKGDESDVVMVVDGEKFDSFTYSSDAVLDMDLSGLSDGSHRISIGFKSRGGDLRLIPLNVRYNKAANTVVFANKR